MKKCGQFVVVMGFVFLPSSGWWFGQVSQGSLAAADDSGLLVFNMPHLREGESGSPIFNVKGEVVASLQAIEKNVDHPRALAWRFKHSKLQKHVEHVLVTVKGFDVSEVVPYSSSNMLQQQEWLTGDNPGFFKGTRMSVRVDNLFNTRQEVVDGNGDTPIRFQPALIDPLGRTISVEFRKLF